MGLPGERAGNGGGASGMEIEREMLELFDCPAPVLARDDFGMLQGSDFFLALSQ